MSKHLKPEWAEKLASTLDVWCKNHGYWFKNKLATELDISPSVWGSISSGDSIVKDSSCYAKLYLRTEIPESDPREIQPMKRVVPSTKETIEIRRAWTEDDWKKWLKSPEADRIRKLKANLEEEEKKEIQPQPQVVAQPQAVPAKEVMPAKTQTIGSVLDGFITVFARQMAEQMGDTIASKIADAIEQKVAPLLDQQREAPPPPPKHEQPSDETREDANLDAGQLAEGLKLLLTQATPDDRTRTYEIHRNQLRDLWRVLGAHFAAGTKELEKSTLAGQDPDTILKDHLNSLLNSFQNLQEKGQGDRDKVATNLRTLLVQVWTYLDAYKEKSPEIRERQLASRMEVKF